VKLSFDEKIVNQALLTIEDSRLNIKTLLLTVCLAVSILFLSTGCGSTFSAVDSFKKRIRGGGDGLMQRVFVLPIIDQAGVGKERVSRLSGLLMEKLVADGRLLVQKAEGFIPATLIPKSPRFGSGFDPDVIKIAEEMNMNAVVMFVIPPFEINTELKGIWPFRKPRRELEISLIVSAVDIMNGTLFMNNMESKKELLPETEPDMPATDEKISNDRLDDILDGLLEDQISALLDAFQDQPWSGRIVSADEKNLIINAGKDVGLQEGRIFDVFARGEAINSVGGKSLFLLGSKIGEIRTVAVMDSRAQATPLNEGDFRAGQVIRVKE
jgi:hypothetical protein